MTPDTMRRWRGWAIESPPGVHMNRLLRALDQDTSFLHYEALAVLASAGQWLLGASRMSDQGRVYRTELETEDWQAAMTLLRLYNAIDLER